MGFSQRYSAVLFDMGGVIVTSPFQGFARYEEAHALPPDTIRSINATNPDTNAWARYERGEIPRDQFVVDFENEARLAGHVLDADAVLSSMSGGRVEKMVEVIAQLKPSYKLGLITNNLTPMRPEESSIADVLAHFDVLVQSSVERLRKPDPAIYNLTCQRLGVEPAECVYLDDLGVNLKPARAMGMHTIKVIDPDESAARLAALLL